MNKNEATERNEWKDAVIDALVVNWHYMDRYEGDPRAAVAALISAEVKLALDPLISSQAVALVQQGRNEAVKIVEMLRDAAHTEWEAGGFKDRGWEGHFVALTEALRRLTA